jgi:hypothetical protein
MFVRQKLTYRQDNILKTKNHCHIPMNYAQYDEKIVQKHGIALVGWPINGSVRNPGFLTCDECIIVKRALAAKQCKWIKLTPQKVAGWKASNVNSANIEDINGPSSDRAGSESGSD